MFIVGGFLLIIILIIAGAIFWGDKKEVEIVDTRTESQKLIDIATGPNPQKTTLTNEQAKALIDATTGQKSGKVKPVSGTERERMIDVATGN